jgi:seryl-tRNA synthetase
MADPYQEKVMRQDIADASFDQRMNGDLIANVGVVVPAGVLRRVIEAGSYFGDRAAAADHLSELLRHAIEDKDAAAADHLRVDAELAELQDNFEELQKRNEALRKRLANRIKITNQAEVVVATSKALIEELDEVTLWEKPAPWKVKRDNLSDDIEELQGDLVEYVDPDDGYTNEELLESPDDQSTEAIEKPGE